MYKRQLFDLFQLALISCDFSGDTVFVCLIKSELLPDFFYIQFFLDVYKRQMPERTSISFA